MINNIIDGIFEVNTSEAYNKDIFVYNKWVIIPYINLQIFNISFPQGMINRYDKLDFSYLIFENVSELLWNYALNSEAKYGKLILNISSFEDDYLIDYVSGTNIMNKIDGCEIKIKFKNQYLYFSEYDVCIKNGPLNVWTPINTPNFARNIDKETVRLFYTKEHIPREILQMIEVNSFSVIKTLDLFTPLTKEEEIRIAKEWLQN